MHNITLNESKKNTVNNLKIIDQSDSKQIDLVSNLGKVHLTDRVGKNNSQQQKTPINSVSPQNRLAQPSSSMAILFKGSQSGCDGTINSQNALVIIENLNKMKEEGIAFSSLYLSETLQGGTCSAMVFDFAHSYFELCKKQAKALDNKNFFRIFLQELSQRFNKSNEEFRTYQAAFNTITAQKTASEIDIEKNKIQSLANLYSFKIVDCSEEIVIEDSIEFQKTVELTISKLKDGIHFLRMICPLENHKLEKKGHSMLYIKNKKVEFTYDPNLGLGYKQNINEPRAEELFKAMTHYLRTFKTSKARFYMLSQK